MSVLDDYREKFPRYKEVDDATLGRALYEKHYSNKLSFDEFSAKVGISGPPAQTESYGKPVQNEQGQYQVGGPVMPTGLDALERTVTGIAGQREALMNNISGAVAGTVAPIGGGIAMVREDVKSAITGQPANPLAGPQARDRIANTLTYQPKTLEGQRIVEGQGDMLQPVAETIEKARLGNEALEAGLPEPVARLGEAIPEYIMAGMAALGLRQPKSPKAVDKYGNVVGVDEKALIADQLRAGKGTGRTAPYKLDPQGNVVKLPAAKAALSQGWDDVTVAGVKSGNPATKSKIRQIISVAKRRLGKNATAQDKIELRPSNVAGKSLHDRYKFISEANNSAGKLSGKIAKDLGKNGVVVDITRAVKELDDQLRELNIGVGKNGRLDFSRAQVVSGDRGLIQESVNHIRNILKTARGGKLNFEGAHRLKQIVRESGLSYKETLTKPGASEKSQGLFKKFTSEVDKALDNVSPAYDKQNIKFATTREAMKTVEKIAKDNLLSESPESNLGTLTKRMMGNPVSRQAVIHYSKKLDEVANQYGGKFDDDLFLQAYVANEMDKVIEVAAQTSLKGEVGAQAFQAVNKSAIGKAAQFVDSASRFVGRKSDQKALDTLQALTME